jgi:lipopolysaccharide export system protein LptA
MFKSLYILCLIIIFSANLFCQDNKPVLLKNAESLAGMVINGEQVRELNGNVELVQGNLNLKCNKARQYLNSNTVEFSGNVIITQDTLKLYSDDGIYYGNTRNAVCNTSVKLNDGHVTLTAVKGSYDANLHKAFFQNMVKVEDAENIIFSDNLIFFRNTNIINGWDNVKLISKNNSTIITGDSLEYLQNTKYTRIHSNAKLIRIDTNIIRSGKEGKKDSVFLDTLFIKSGVLESKRDSIQSILIATDSVRLFRGELAASSGMLQYFSKDSNFFLDKNPVIWYGSNQITGDTIDVFLKESTLYKIKSNHNAFAISKLDTALNKRYNQVSGEIIQIYFRERKIDSIVAENQSRALYYIDDSDKPNGMNKASGDKILMMFKTGKIQNVKVLNGVEGNYFPEKLISNRESEFDIPGFKVIGTRPKRSDY